MAQTATRGASPLYRDIAERTQGELYIGVVGPVRAGKSTFISNFMQQLVLPLVPPGPRRERIVDELPQSGSGKTIMTTQPKFVPSDGAATVQLPDHASARVRMVDSVGYLVRGALGTQEGGDARMVSTPWSQQDMPFEEAAQLGTRKVMTDHATVGVVVTTDGTVAELPREAYVPAEEQVIRELKTLGKPFAVVLNSAQPESRQAKELQAAMSEKYDAPVTLLSAKEMTAEDVQGVMRDLLSAFPLREMRFTLPEWVSALDDQHWLTQHIVSLVREAGAQIVRMRDAEKAQSAFAASEYADTPQLDQLEYGEGSARFESAAEKRVVQSNSQRAVRGGDRKRRASAAPAQGAGQRQEGIRPCGRRAARGGGYRLWAGCPGDERCDALRARGQPPGGALRRPPARQGSGAASDSLGYRGRGIARAGHAGADG